MSPLTQPLQLSKKNNLKGKLIRPYIIEKGIKQKALGVLHTAIKNDESSYTLKIRIKSKKVAGRLSAT